MVLLRVQTKVSRPECVNHGNRKTARRNREIGPQPVEVKQPVFLFLCAFGVYFGAVRRNSLGDGIIFSGSRVKLSGPQIGVWGLCSATKGRQGGIIGG